MMFFLNTWSVCLIILNSYNTNAAFIDKSNFICKLSALTEFQEALRCLNSGYHVQALEHFIQSFFISPTSIAALKIARILRDLSSLENAIYWFEQSIEMDKLNIEAYLELGILRHHQGNELAAVECYNKALLLDPINSELWFSLGVSYQFNGDVQRSIGAYTEAVRLNSSHIKATLNLAAMYQNIGMLEESILQYQKGLFALNRQQYPSWELTSMMKTNLGAAFMQRGSFVQAFEEYKSLQQLLQNILEQQCVPLDRHQPQQQQQQQYLNLKLECKQVQNAYDVCVSHTLTASRAICYWYHYEKDTSYLLVKTLENTVQSPSVQGPLLPFDTLLLPISMQHRLQIAVGASLRLAAIARSLSIDNEPTVPIASTNQIQGISSNSTAIIRIGWLSYDFRNHPTCHLALALLYSLKSSDYMKKYTMEIFVYSYGEDDNSTCRHNIRLLSDRFVDLSMTSLSDAVTWIRNDSLDLLLDMQLHTLGHRMEITATRLASTQVSYLVFPGTSGATFLDYIIGDRVVTPPEHAGYYSESLLLMPPTYQVSVNSVEESHSATSICGGTGGRVSCGCKSTLRKKFGLPPLPAPVLCNFNKVDKISPDSFNLWMQVMRRLPTSVLWLLLPKKYNPDVVGSVTSDGLSDRQSDQNTLVMRHLRNQAMSQGIAPSRIHFANWVPKSDHISRHVAADLFLDTIVYGAHSTATDALRGGLPVLTLVGEGYVSRVGASLYEATGIHSMQDILVTTSILEFENTAVRLLKQMSSEISNPNQWSQKGYLNCPTNQVLSYLSLELMTIQAYPSSRRQGGLFDNSTAAFKFYISMQVLNELDRLKPLIRKSKNIIKNRHHIVIGDS